MKVLVTGSAGFLAGYVIPELLGAGHEVVGIDDESKYGPIRRELDGHPGYRFVLGDAKDAELVRSLAGECDQLLAAAARIGGVAYVRANAYDLFVENERLTLAAFDAAVWAHRHRHLKKIDVISSSLVYEGTSELPTPEGAELRCPAPRSTYGLQKLAAERLARSALEQHGLPYTIIRPFNTLGIVGPRVASGPDRGRIAAALTHVVPDLVRKVVAGQDPLHILGSGRGVRHFTYAGDLARGIRLCIEHPAAVNQDFNLSTPRGHTILEVAEIVWRMLKPGEPFRYACDDPLKDDVERLVPSVEKARTVLGFEATTPLETILAEVVPWVVERIRLQGG